MNLNLNIIVDLYKKTSIFILITTIISFILVSFLYGIFKGFSVSIGSFLLFLNVSGISLIAKFSEGKSKINKDRIIFSIFLFVGKMFLIIFIIFILLYFKLVNTVMFIIGLSIGFFIFFIANLIFLPIKIHKYEQSSNG